MTQILQANPENITKLATLLQAGHVIAFPTETVYGLGADASNPNAVKKIYEIKNRPAINPLISHYSSFEKVYRDVLVNDTALKLAAKFCPGPLTFVLPKTKNSRISDIASAGLPTAAVRIPVHSIARELLAKLDVPIVAPSANPSTRVSPVSAQHVYDYFQGKLDYILDGGACEIGLESTVIDLTSEIPRILRYGKITADQIEAIVGKVLLPEDEVHEIKSPGMMFKHYSPKAKLRMGCDNPRPNEALLAFGSENIPKGFTLIKNLSLSENLEEAAANLFGYLHELDQMDISGIAVMPIPEHGFGKAINDRLKRASN